MITQDDIIYFIMTDRFNNGDTGNDDGVDLGKPRMFHGGDLKGISDKIGYLKSLGITAVWITPVYVNTAGFDDQKPYHYYWPKEFSVMDKRLYSGSAHPEGSMLYLADFVKQMHDNKLKVILDVIVNHGGYGIESENIAFPPDWFNDAGISSTTDPENGRLDGLPDFDHDNVNVVDYFINNLIHWVELTGVDGLRMDTAFHVENRFWYNYKSQVKGRFPDLFLVGEILKTGKSDISTLADYQRDYDFSSVFDFPLREQLKNCFIYDEPLYKLARPRLDENEEYGILDLDNSSLEKRREGRGGYSNANRLVTLLDNHDLDQRIISHARSKHPGTGGKQISFRVTELCYAFMLTVRGIPQIYYGSEIGLEGWKNASGDADLRRDFPWDRFLADGSPDLALGDESGLFLAVQRLISLRKTNDALKYGTLITLWVDRFIFCFLRFYKGNIILVAFNNGYGDMPTPLPVPILRNNNKHIQTVPDRVLDLIEGGIFENLMNGAETSALQNGFVDISLKGKGYKIYRLRSV